MRTRLDAVRSLKKYAWLVLGEEWEVRLADEEGLFERPFARVDVVGPMTTSGARVARCEQRFSIVCHPAESASVDEAIVAAERVADRLWRGFRQGLTFTEPGTLPPVEIRGFPFRVPMWDFDGVSLDDTAWERAPRGQFMRVPENGFTVEQLSDPNDPMLRVVVASVTVSWFKQGVVPDTTPVLAGTNLTLSAEGVEPKGLTVGVKLDVVDEVSNTPSQVGVGQRLRVTDNITHG